LVTLAASAGGLEALKRFLSEVEPDERVAYVIIQHLDPSHQSMFPELLQRVTTLPVVQADSEQRLEAGRVYMIPPNRYLQIEGDQMTAKEPGAPRGQRMAVDHFLRSAAESYGSQCVCCILSGSGTDGSQGAKAVREAGGLILVQEPQEAGFDGMPQSAIMNQLEDRVLPVGEMPALIREFLDGEAELPAPIQREDDSDKSDAADQSDQLNRVLRIIRERTGYDFTHYRTATIARRVHRRMRLNRCAQPQAYIDLLRNDDEEVGRLRKDLLISVTHFFRDPEVFDVLREEALPGLISRLPQHEPLRVWVPAVATGEEAYSLAILIRESFEANNVDRRLQVFATDIDDHALSVARSGWYPPSIQADVSAKRLERWFIAERGGYRVHKAIRDSVTFAQQNLLEDPPFSKLDLISCRNLLIYLETEAQERVIELMHFALKPEGCLVLGPAETVARRSALFKQIGEDRRVYTALEPPQPRRRRLPTSPFERQRKAGPALDRLQHRQHQEHLLAQAAHQALMLHERMCLAVVNKDLSLRYTLGEPGPYLEVPSGVVDRHLGNLAKNGLRGKVRMVLHNVIEDERPESQTLAHLKIDGVDYRVQLTARPVDTSEELYACIFQIREPLNTPNQGAGSDGAETTEEADRRIAELERELQTTREDLNATIQQLETTNEELRASNEEVISVNEELQSTNEELETSKEELQSVNEELTTVNQQLEEKMNEVARSRDDMANLLASTDIATIFLDEDLCIRRTTESANRLLNTRPQDNGRHMGHFASVFQGADLTELAEEVLQKRQQKEVEARTREGHWYALRITPYRGTEGELDGVVVTLVDIDRLKRTEERLRTSERRLSLALYAAALGTHEYFFDSGEVIWDQRCREIFGIHDDRPIDFDLFRRMVQEQDYPSVEQALERAKDPRGDGYYEATYRVRPLDGQPERWVFATGQSVFDWRDGSLHPVRLVGTAQDVTLQRQAKEALQRQSQELEQRVHRRTDQLRKARDQVRRLHHLTATAEQRERRRIAEGLHDDVQQLLSAVRMGLAGLLAKVEDPEQTQRLRQVERWTDQALQATRSLIFDLSPAVLYEMGLLPAVEHLVQEMQRRFGLEVELRSEGEIDPVPEELRVFLYSAARELLFNTAKHAQADSAQVELTQRKGYLCLVVEDNGRGFDPNAQKADKGALMGSGSGTSLGLSTLRERVRQFEGDLDIQTTPGRGCRVSLWAPYQERGGDQADDREQDTQAAAGG
jgi:two-component system CheB/CheR fusion protein